MKRTTVLICLVGVLGTACSLTAAPLQDDLAAVARISQADFRKALAAGTILVVDVRDTGSYATGHIPGAVSIPLDEVLKHAQELKGERKPIVAYCA